MTKELTLVDAQVLTPEEKTELDAELDRIIEAHKANRKEINRLVFESVAAMTEADEAGQKLANKGFFSRLIGGITGSNQKLQNKINASRAAAQYASQQTLQKLAEQNLLTFDLLAAVNNKLNASMKLVGTEFTKLYAGLEKFFQYNQSQLVRMELRLEKVERNVNLLTWQNSVEYLDFNGKGYPELDEAGKIVCLVRDFYDITKGEYSTSDLLLLKSAMDAVGLPPKTPVNYGAVVEAIADNDAYRSKLLAGKEIRPIEDPGHLVAMSGIQKLDALQHEERYLPETVAKYVAPYDASVTEDAIRRDLAKAYLRNNAGADVDMDVESFDMVLDLLYSVKQADAEGLLLAPGEEANMQSEDAAQVEEKPKPVVPEKDEQLVAAEKLFFDYKLKEAYQQFMELANAGNARAMYYVGLYAKEGYASVKRYANTWCTWWKRGAEAGDALSAVRYAATLPERLQTRQSLLATYVPQVLAEADAGDVAAQCEAARMYGEGFAVEQDLPKMAGYFAKMAEQGFWLAKYELARCYEEGRGVDKDERTAFDRYLQLAYDGYIEGQYQLGRCYEKGIGTEKNESEAVEWYRKTAEKNYAPAQNAMGFCCENDIGGWHTCDEAREWYEKAAAQGYIPAQINLGNYYAFDNFLRHDSRKAMEWYRKAAEQGDACGQNKLGNCYYKGEYVSQNYQEAVKWYRKASQQGYAPAQHNLSVCYRYGRGIEKDDDQAKELLAKAEAQGIRAGGNTIV